MDILHRSLIIAILLGAGTLSTTALANRCIEPMRYGSAATDVLSPMAAVADSMLRADLDAARAETDGIRAIAQLQQHQFAMSHPQTPEGFENHTYLRIRCGTQASYIALDDEIRRQVRNLAPRYRKERWYIGTRSQKIHLHSDYHAKPGLLNLLLMANEYDAFEQEVRSFLRSAIGDAEAADYFQDIGSLAKQRQEYLLKWQEDYAQEYVTGGIGLLPRELAGIKALRGFSARIDPLRQQHVDHWLAAEAKSYQTVLADKPKPGQLLHLTNSAQVAAEQLKLAKSVGLPDAQPQVVALAKRRGDALMKIERFAAAIEYYDVAGAETERQRAQAQIDAIGAQKIERLRNFAERDIEKMRKTDSERAAFEDDTDALADELGIDLEDF